MLSGYIPTYTSRLGKSWSRTRLGARLALPFSMHKTSEGFWHVWHMCLAIIMAPLSLVCCSWNSGGGVPIFLDYWDGLIRGSGHFSHLYLLCIPLTVKSTLRCSPLCLLPMIVLYSVTSHVNLCFLCFPRFSTLRMDPPFNVHTKRCITICTICNREQPK